MEPNRNSETLDEIMDEEKRLTDHLSEKSTWIRLLYMILFGIVYEIAEWVIFLVAAVQFLFKLFTGDTNPRLRSLGQSLAVFVGDIAAFLTFRSEAKPYPWGDWPSGGAETPSAAAKARTAAPTAKKRPVTRPRRRTAARSAAARSGTSPSTDTSEPAASSTTEPRSGRETPPGLEPGSGEASSEEPKEGILGTDSPGEEDPENRGGGSGT